MCSTKSKRSHSFGGCATCRRRHVKCDQKTPTCERCRRAGLSCSFAPTLRWLVSTGLDIHVCEEDRLAEDDAAAPRTKQHLYTETARSAMSASLAKDLPSTVSAAIDDLTEVENSPDFSDQDCFRQLGPFGVFKASAQVPREEEGSLTESMPYPSQYLTIGNVDFYTSPCFTTSHLDPGSSDPTLGMLTAEAEAHEDLDVFLTRSLDTMQWGDLFQWNADYFTTTDIRPGSSIPNFTDQTSIHDDVGIMSIATVDTACDDFQWPEIDLSSEAPLLLKHFNNEVITQMGSLPINVKSAWRTLNFPSAVFTLSQLTILGLELSTIKRANLANFFALIAVSALHLSLRSDTQTNTPDTSDKSRHWRSLSTRTYKAAKDLLRASFATECASQGKAKYKDQLMAVGAVLATALVSGNVKDVRRYLTEMERLIRYRGLTKQVISRRARLLHNVYAWMRIISESTNLLHDEHQSSKSTEAPAAEDCFTTELPAESSSLHNSREASARGLDDFLYLEEYRTRANHNTTMHRDSSEGQLDLHLTNPLVERDGMCMQIYGVPETWLRLVSQTTRLANMLDKLNPSISETDFKVFARLQTTSATLENAVCAFRERFQPPPPAASPHEHMVRALGAALVIFFYRRIRNIRPLMLQESVTQVIASLHAFDAALEQYSMPGPGTAWPAYMAGAEAMRQPQRQAITAWLDKAHLKTGWKGYSTSQRVLNELWKRRDEALGNGSHELATWVGVCKDLQCWPLLC